MKLITDEIIEGCKEAKQLVESELFRLYAPNCWQYVIAMPAAGK